MSGPRDRGGDRENAGSLQLAFATVVRSGSGTYGLWICVHFDTRSGPKQFTLAQEASTSNQTQKKVTAKLSVGMLRVRTSTEP